MEKSLKLDFLSIVKWGLIGLIFSLFLITIGKNFISPPSFYIETVGGSEPKYFDGESFLYNVTDIKLNESYVLRYVYKSNCFSIYSNGSYLGNVCKSNTSSPFPFMRIIPDKDSASILVFSEFNKNRYLIENYTISVEGETLYNGEEALILKDDLNTTYIVNKRRGYLLMLNSSSLFAFLIERS